jgi:hypothetical protein
MKNEKHPPSVSQDVLYLGEAEHFYHIAGWARPNIFITLEGLSQAGRGRTLYHPGRVCHRLALPNFV